MRGYHLTNEVRQKIIKLHAEGLSPATLAERFGVSSSAITYTLCKVKNGNVPLRKTSNK